MPVTRTTHTPDDKAPPEERRCHKHITLMAVLKSGDVTAVTNASTT
jgi:hypothetical protein